MFFSTVLAWFLGTLIPRSCAAAPGLSTLLPRYRTEQDRCWACAAHQCQIWESPFQVCYCGLLHCKVITPVMDTRAWGTEIFSPQITIAPLLLMMPACPAKHVGGLQVSFYLAPNWSLCGSIQADLQPPLHQSI